MNKFSILSIFVLAALLFSLGGVSPATAALVDGPWTGSGPGTTAVTSDEVSTEFSYDYSMDFSGAWTFSTTAAADGSHTIYWHYTGLHSWFLVTVGLDAFVERNGAPIMTTNLVNAGPAICCTPPSNGFDYSGTFTFAGVQAGDEYGFKLRGSHFDSSMILRGTLALYENSGPIADAGGPYSGDEGSPISLDGSGSYLPEPVDSCQDVRDIRPTAVDGEYVIFPNDQGFSVYCHDMAGTPQEFLSLVNTGGSANFSQYTAGGASWGSDVRTSYTKLRLDPQTLLVDISNQTFATSTGSLMHSGSVAVTSMPYGVAMGCLNYYMANGVANIDLQGTPFAVSDTFVLGGFLPAGSAVFSAADQVVNLTGGGFCGWNISAPDIYDPFNQAGGFQLNLAYTGPLFISQPLTYAWSVDSSLCSFDDATSPTPNLTCTDDGDFVVTLVVDDGLARGHATAAVTVNNVAPTVSIDSVSPVLAAVGTPVTASGSFTDPGTSDTHTAVWDWGDASPSAGTLSGLTVGPDSHTYTQAGIYTLQLDVTDDDGGVGSALYQSVVIYDPQAGFVTGGGWIDSPAGAYLPDASMAGKANFGFNAKYLEGADTPTGNTEFQFHATDFNFHASGYEWLVVTGGNFAVLKGTGTLNGADGYLFMIWAGDGTGSDGADTFRIKIWTEQVVIYDNGMNQAISGGSIVLHSN